MRLPSMAGLMRETLADRLGLGWRAPERAPRIRRANPAKSCYSAAVALSTSTDTPGPIVELSEIFFM